MPWYNDLRPATDEKKQFHGLVFPGMTEIEKKRTIVNLLKLRAGLTKEIAPKYANQNLIVATWNLKEFGHLNERLPESYFYIAEIIGRFDLVAIQEVKSTMKDLEIVMRLLGDDWAYMVADITEGTDGNSERFAYIYDKRRVQPSGLAGEIVLWDDITADSTVKQLKRTPFITGFTAGWKSFAIVNVHLQPGDRSEKAKKRKEEVRLLMKAIQAKFDKGRFWTENLLMMGDFNLYRSDGHIVNEIYDHGFKELPSLRNKATNVPGTEVYDRIFFHETEYFRMATIDGKRLGGVVKFFDYVYEIGQESEYRDFMLAHKDDPTTLVDDDAFAAYFRNYWRRGQVSDHFPVWLQIEIDSSEDFLSEKLAEFSSNLGPAKFASAVAGGSVSAITD